MKPSKPDPATKATSGLYNNRGGSPLRFKTDSIPVKLQRGPTKADLDSKLKQDLRRQIFLKEQELARMIASAQEVATKAQKLRQPRIQPESLARPKSLNNSQSMASHKVGKIVSQRSRVPSQQTKTTPQRESGRIIRLQFSNRGVSNEAQPTLGQQSSIKQVSPLRLINNPNRSFTKIEKLEKEPGHQNVQRLSLIPKQELKKSLPLRNKSRSPHNKDLDMLRQSSRDINPTFATMDVPHYASVPNFRDELRPRQVEVNPAPAMVRNESHAVIVKSRVPQESMLERVNQLNNDIVGIRKRIDMIRQDLDRTQHEKAEMQKRLVGQASTTNEVDLLLKQLTQDHEANQKSWNAKIEIERAQKDSLHERIQVINKQKKETTEQISKAISAAADKDQSARRINLEIKQLQQDQDMLIRQNQHTLGEVASVDTQIREMTQKQLDLNQQLSQLEIQRDLKQSERNKLMKEYGQMTDLYHNTRSALTKNNEGVNRDKRFKAKQVACRVLCHQLDMLRFNAVYFSFRRVHQFSTFDKRAMKALKALVRIMFKLGSWKKSQGLHIWYLATLKPYEMMKQNFRLASKRKNKTLLSHVFTAWKQYQKGRIDSYKAKAGSVQKIIDKLEEAAKMEQKRALLIWKSKVKFGDLKSSRLKKQILKSYKHRLHQRFLQWRKYSITISMSCRIELIKRDYAQKFYLTTLWSGFKQQVFLQRREKWRVQLRIFKAWKDFISYKRFHYHSNIAVSKILIVNRKYILQTCLHALKLNKEQSKAKIMATALDQDVNVAIQHYTSQANTITRRVRRTEQTRAIGHFRDQFAKKLFSYFSRWRHNTSEFDIRLRSRVTSLIIRNYTQNLQHFFELWRFNKSKKSKQVKKRMLMEMQQEGRELENETLKNFQKEKVKLTEVRSSQQKQQLKVIRRFFRRTYEIAFGRWRDHMALRMKVRTKQNDVIGKMRKRLLRQAFEKYANWVQKEKKLDVDSEKAKRLIFTFDLRRMRTIYNSWYVYANNHQKARRYWKRIFNRFDEVALRSAIRAWQLNAHNLTILNLREKQSDNACHIEGKCQLLSQQEKEIADGLKLIKQIDETLRKKTHKEIGNYLVRFYDTTTAEVFKRWRRRTQGKAYKQRIVKHIVEHMRMQQMLAIRSAFKSFVTQEVQKAKIGAIKSVRLECESEQQYIKFGRETIEKERVKVKARAVQSQNHAEFKKKRIDKNIAILIRRSQQFESSSKKRKCFEAIRDIGKQDRAFVLAVSNVLTKSMLSHGFENVKQHSRLKFLNQLKYRHINQMILRFMKVNMNEFFGRWKEVARMRVNQTYAETKASYEEAVLQNANLIADIKHQNTTNVEHFIHKRRLKALYCGWLKEIQIRKKLRINSEESKNVLAGVCQKRGVQKWFHRLQLVKRLRFNIKTMKRDKEYRLKRMVWDGFWKRRKITTHLATSICNLDKLLRDKNKIIAYRTLQSYTTSKKYGSRSRKQISIDNVFSILNQRNEIILKRYFSKYRAEAKAKIVREKEFRKITLNLIAHHKRWAFHAWRRKMQDQLLVKEMNEVGPVTEQVFEANRAIRNLKEFMLKEGFTKEEISRWWKRVEDTNEYLMNKIVTRLRIPKQNRIMVRAFDQWVMWMRIKRVFKFKLRYCNDIVQPVKCQLRQAFNQWKYGDLEYSKAISRCPISKLQMKNIRQTDELGKLAKMEAENQIKIKNLSNDRNKLLDHSIRAKKKALQRIHDGYLQDLRKAMTRWKGFKHDDTCLDGKLAIKQAIEQTAALKERVNKIEIHNHELADENEELRKFSMEGFTIANTLKDLDAKNQVMRDELDLQNKRLAELVNQHNEIMRELKSLDAVDELGFHPDCQFLYQTFIKDYGNGKGGMKAMPGVVRDKSNERKENKENITPTFIEVPERN